MGTSEPCGRDGRPGDGGAFDRAECDYLTAVAKLLAPLPAGRVGGDGGVGGIRLVRRRGD